MCEYDPEILIEEVKKRPAIWDYTLPDYSYKELKNKCWNEIADIFNTNQIANKYERIELARQLQRKWKSLRDCFSRELSRRRKMEEGKVKYSRHKYIYYKPLQFLLKTKSSEGTGAGAEAAVDEGEGAQGPAAAADDDDSDDDIEDRQPLRKKGSVPLRKSVMKVEAESREDTDSETEPVQQEKRPKKTQKIRKIEVPVVNYMDESATSDCGDMEAEKMFLLSMLKPLKQVPMPTRLQVQMDMMGVIQNALQNSTTEFMMPETEFDDDD